MQFFSLFKISWFQLKKRKRFCKQFDKFIKRAFLTDLLTAGYNSQSGYGSQPCSTQSYNSSSGMMGYNTPPSSYADGSHQTTYMGYNNQPTSYGDVPHPSYHRDSMGFDSQGMLKE